MEPVKKPPNRPPHCELSLRLLAQAKLLARKVDESNPSGAVYIAAAILRQVEAWAQEHTNNGRPNS